MKNKAWSEEEIKQLRNASTFMSNKDLAKLLHRSEAAIKLKLHELNRSYGYNSKK